MNIGAFKAKSGLGKAYEIGLRQVLKVPSGDLPLSFSINDTLISINEKIQYEKKAVDLRIRDRLGHVGSRGISSVFKTKINYVTPLDKKRKPQEVRAIRKSEYAKSAIELRKLNSEKERLKDALSFAKGREFYEVKLRKKITNVVLNSLHQEVNNYTKYLGGLKDTYRVEYMKTHFDEDPHESVIKLYFKVAEKRYTKENPHIGVYEARQPTNEEELQRILQPYKTPAFDFEKIRYVIIPILWIDWERAIISALPRSKREFSLSEFIVKTVIEELIIWVLLGPIVRGILIAGRVIKAFGSASLKLKSVQQLRKGLGSLSHLPNRAKAILKGQQARFQNIPRAKVQMAVKSPITNPGRVIASETQKVDAARKIGATSRGTETVSKGSKTQAIVANEVRRTTIPVSEVLVGTKRAKYRRDAARIIRETPNHPLKGLLNESGSLRSGFRKSHDKLWDNPHWLEMGHVTSKKSKEVERIVLQSAATNQFDRVTVEGIKGAHAFVKNEVLSIATPEGIGAVAVELRTAKDLVDFGILKKSVFDNAPLIIF